MRGVERWGEEMGEKRGGGESSRERRGEDVRDDRGGEEKRSEDSGGTRRGGGERRTEKKKEKRNEWRNGKTRQRRIRVRGEKEDSNKGTSRPQSRWGRRGKSGGRRGDGWSE